MANFWRFPRVRSWEYAAFDVAFAPILEKLDVPLSKTRPYLSLRAHWLKKARLLVENGAIPDGEEGIRRLAMCLPLCVWERRQYPIYCMRIACPDCYARRFLLKTCRLIWERHGTGRRTFRVSSYFDDTQSIPSFRRPRARDFPEAAGGVTLVYPVAGSARVTIRTLLIGAAEGEPIRGKRALARVVGETFYYPTDVLEYSRRIFGAFGGSEALFEPEKTRWYSTFGSLWGSEDKDDS